MTLGRIVLIASGIPGFLLGQTAQVNVAVRGYNNVNVIGAIVTFTPLPLLNGHRLVVPPYSKAQSAGADGRRISLPFRKAPIGSAPNRRV